MIKKPGTKSKEPHQSLNIKTTSGTYPVDHLENYKVAVCAAADVAAALQLQSSSSCSSSLTDNSSFLCGIYTFFPTPLIMIHMPAKAVECCCCTHHLHTMLVPYPINLKQISCSILFDVNVTNNICCMNFIFTYNIHHLL